MYPQFAVPWGAKLENTTNSEGLLWDSQKISWYSLTWWMEVLWKSTHLSSISRSSFKVHLGKPNQWLSRQIRSLAMGFWTNVMQWLNQSFQEICLSKRTVSPIFVAEHIKCLKSTPPRNTLRFRCWIQDVNWIYCLWFMDNKHLHHLGCTVLTRSTNQRDKQPIPTGDRTYNGFLFGSCLGDTCLKFLPTSGQHEASCTHSCASWGFLNMSSWTCI